MFGNEAIAKITAEMMKEDDPLIQMLEEHLTSICTNSRVAAKILVEDKTLKEARDKLYAEAKKKQQNGGAWISDEECCRRAEEYFGITEEDKTGNKRSRGSSDNVVNIFDLM